jgi:hypothetical protein
LDDRGTIPNSGNVGIFTLRRRVQTGSGAHPFSSPVDKGAPSRGVKRPGREADHSRLSSTKVKNAWNCTSTPPNVFMAWCLIKQRLLLHVWYLVKHRDFTFTFAFLDSRLVKLSRPINLLLDIRHQFYSHLRCINYTAHDYDFLIV